MFFLVHFYITILKYFKKILVIIQRSNGDVFLSSPLIKALNDKYESPQIDLLVNDDTISIAKLIPNINNIYTFSYRAKQDNKWRQEKNILSSLFNKYELCINLTSSDRSVFYALIAGKKTISAVENNYKKSWWKKILLTHYYHFDSSRHILQNNLESLKFLNIDIEYVHYPLEPSFISTSHVKKKLDSKKISNFYIFHPSSQYKYKIYPQYLRDALLNQLSKIGISIVVTGGQAPIDFEIKKQLPILPNLFDFIGETSMEEFVALSKLSLGYIGMDTLNMHISASQNKRIFAIFGPTNLKMWSPWSLQLNTSAKINMPIQTYGNITIFQANMQCVACGQGGCDNSGKSECLNNISPEIVFEEVSNWYKNVEL